MKFIQEEAMKVNEDLRKVQSQIFHTLGDVQRHYDDLVMLQEHVDEQMGKYKEAQHAFYKVADWQERHTSTPETLPRYSDKHEIKIKFYLILTKKYLMKLKKPEKWILKLVLGFGTLLTRY
jgi:hypothetical protein